MNGVDDESNATAELLRSAREGNRQALDELFSRHRRRLRRMVSLRMDRRLQGRIDASDVIQEACVEALERIEAYFEKPSMPFFLWLRFITAQKLVALHRHHLGTKARDPRREVSLHHGAWPEATSGALAAQLLGHFTTPTQAAARAELRMRFQEALNGMDVVDREILALRHFEQLSNAEAARELGIQQAAASKRYTRALRRLKEIVTALQMDSGSFLT